MSDYIAMLALGAFFTAGTWAIWRMIGWLGGLVPQTEQNKRASENMKVITGYLNRVCGTLSLLFVAGGLFIMAADYIHNLNKDDNDPAVNTTVCLRLGTCEAS